jgi:hypothetical protein
MLSHPADFLPAQINSRSPTEVPDGSTNQIRFRN